MFCSYTTGLGFLLHGILAILQSPVNERGAIKVLPHIIDTVLLASGLVMAISWVMLPATQLWLIAKILAVLLYILFLVWSCCAGVLIHTGYGLALSVVCLSMATLSALHIVSPHCRLSAFYKQVLQLEVSAQRRKQALFKTDYLKIYSSNSSFK